MKKISILSLLLISTTAMADVLEVNIWKPITGKGPLTAQYGAEARAIQEKLGGNVTLAFDTMGRMHFGMGFANWTEWAKHSRKVEASEEWSKFWDKANRTPSAELEAHYLLNVTSPGGIGAVYQVFVWEATGTVSALVASAMEAEKIHEKGGAEVSINLDQMNRVHYVMSFESLEAWARFQDTPNEEWASWWAEAQKNPAGNLVKVYTATQM